MSIVADSAFVLPLGADAALLPRTPAITDAYHELLVANQDVSNARSRAVAARLGFAEEGILRQAIAVQEVWRDDVVFGLLAEQWQTRRGGA